MSANLSKKECILKLGLQSDPSYFELNCVETRDGTVLVSVIDLIVFLCKKTPDQAKQSFFYFKRNNHKVFSQCASFEFSGSKHIMFLLS